MASEIKVDNIKDQCGTAVITKCGATHTVTAEVYKANTIKDTSDNTYLAKCGSTVTLGGCGQTIALAAGASQTGFGRTGTVDWDTTAKTASFTAVSGNGYFVNTTSGAITVTLPSSPSAGDIVAIADYANTADTNNITIDRNGSPIEGQTVNPIISAEGGTITLVYVDGTQGWRPINSANSADLPLPALFTTATGGTITTCGDYKIHTFTGPGTFCVSQVGNNASNPAGGPSAVSYMVVAGGGGGAIGDRQGGGGAGGFREGRVTAPEYPASPLVTTGLTITASPYPITVGAGGAGGAPAPNYNLGSDGANSIFSSITSTGGGGGGSTGPSNTGNPGGSGGGGGIQNTGPGLFGGGSGNTPPVSPPQGNNGGRKDSSPNGGSGGGGGAGAAGGDGCASPPGTGGVGGAGVTTSINGSPVTRAGGGGGGGDSGPQPGGSGGGGAAKSACSPGTGNAGTANTGGGGGGTSYCFQGTKPAGAAGGSGIVIIRYKYQ